MKFISLTLCLSLFAVVLSAQTVDKQKEDLEKSSTVTMIDFTDPATPVFGTDNRVVVNGVALLRAGDINSDGVVDALDYSNPVNSDMDQNNDVVDWLTTNGQLTDYLNNGGADLNMDGFINAIDLNFFWFPNLGQVAQLPENQN